MTISTSGSGQKLVGRAEFGNVELFRFGLCSAHINIGGGDNIESGKDRTVLEVDTGNGSTTDDPDFRGLRDGFDFLVFGHEIEFAPMLGCAVRCAI